MEGEGLSVEVLPHAAHLHCELGVSWAPVGVGGTQEGHGVVSLLKDQHTDHLLVAVYDEIATEFVAVLCQLYQLLLLEAG